MAGFWSMYCYWRKNGYCHRSDPEVFYIYFFSHPRVTGYFLLVLRFLDECEKLYSKLEEKSFTLLIIYIFSSLPSFHAL